MPRGLPSHVPQTAAATQWQWDSLGSETTWLSWTTCLNPSHMVQTLITQTLSQANPTAITAEEYFNPNFELGNRDMGRPMELTTKTQK